jgi:uncharacterized membrane protein YjfL (UPF0719 family)
MSKPRIGMILALIVNLVLGVIAGLVSLSIFRAHVSALEVSNAEKAAAIWFMAAGLGLGVVNAAWTLLFAKLAPQFRGKSPNKAA